MQRQRPSRQRPPPRRQSVSCPHRRALSSVTQVPPSHTSLVLQSAADWHPEAGIQAPFSLHTWDCEQSPFVAHGVAGMHEPSSQSRPSEQSASVVQPGETQALLALQVLPLGQSSSFEQGVWGVHDPLSHTRPAPHSSLLVQSLLSTQVPD